MKELISIIVPVYNVEEYVEDCINSILNQTYLNLEIIMIDDGSTDKSGVICDEFSKKDSRIHVIHKKNAGLSEARNTGLDIAKGEYILFVDSDDWIDHNMVEVLYENLVSKNCDIVLCGVYEEIPSGVTSYEKCENIEYHSVEAFLNMRNSILCTTVVWNKLYRREIWNDLRFPKGKNHEDVWMGHYIYDRADKIVCISDVLYHNRVRQNSIMNSSYNLGRLNQVYAARDRIYYLDGKADCNVITISYIYYINYLMVHLKQIDKHCVKDEKNKYLSMLKNYLKVDYRFFRRKIKLSTKNKIRMILLFILNRKYINMMNKLHMWPELLMGI